MATRKKLDHSQIVERPRTEWNHIFNLADMAYGTKLTSYKGNQDLVYVPDFVSRVVHFKPHCAVICHKRVFDKFDDGIKMNSALAYLRKPDAFPDEYAEGPRSFIKRNRNAVIGKIVSEDDPETLDAYLLQFEKKLELKELDDMLVMAADNLNIRAFLVERKARLFSPEEQEQLERKQQKTDLGLREMTLTEWKAIWSFKTGDDGTIILTGYKGNDTNVDIPANIGKNAVSSLGDYALSPDAPRITGDQKEHRRRIQTITIPEGILHIGESAFASCSCLLSVFLPSTLSDLGECVFSGCSSLSDALIPKGVKSIGADAFSRCKNLTSMTIPEGVTSIGCSAFDGCNSLTSVAIPDSMTKIGNRAFSGCSGLTSMVIPEKVTSISSYAFEGCSRLTSVTIPDGVTKIGNHAFDGCSGLTSVTIPESVMEIGDWAFSGCGGLTSVTIPDSVTSIGWSVFSGCSSLTSVKIPDGVTSIGDEAFSRCSSVTSVVIPDSVTSISNWVFSDCSSLASVTIPDNVTKIGNRAFSGCSGVTSMVIPEKVTSIGNYAFEGCSSLVSVVIPASVTSIGNWAFRDCSGLHIHAPAGSYAEQYAKENEIPFAAE